MSQPTTGNDNQATGGSTVTVTNPVDGKPATGTPTAVPTAPKDQSQSQAPDKGAEWQEKYSGQLKVNRDLEDKLNGLRNGLAGLAGLEGKKASTDDLVANLTETVGTIKHELLVERVARENKIDDNDDLELIRGLTDEAAMRKLAARLASATEAATGGKPKSPKPDGSVGTGDGKPAVKAGEAGKAEAARRFASKGQTK